MSWMEWYDTQWKPSWTPAPSTIGLIWQILYPIIIVTFGFVFVETFRRKVPWMVALPFASNLGPWQVPHPELDGREDQVRHEASDKRLGRTANVADRSSRGIEQHAIAISLAVG